MKTRDASELLRLDDAQSSIENAAITAVNENASERLVDTLHYVVSSVSILRQHTGELSDADARELLDRIVNACIALDKYINKERESLTSRMLAALLDASRGYATIIGVQQLGRMEG